MDNQGWNPGHREHVNSFIDNTIALIKRYGMYAHRGTNWTKAMTFDEKGFLKMTVNNMARRNNMYLTYQTLLDCSPNQVWIDDYESSLLEEIPHTLDKWLQAADDRSSPSTLSDELKLCIHLIIFIRKSGIQIDAIQDRRLFNVEEHQDFMETVKERCQPKLIPSAMHGEGTVSIWHQQPWNLPEGKCLSDLRPTSKLNPPRPDDIAPDMRHCSLHRILRENQITLTGSYIVNAYKYKVSLDTGPSKQLTASASVQDQLRREQNVQMASGLPAVQLMPSVYSPMPMRANQVPMTSPAYSHQLDAYGVPDRQRMLERWAPPTTIASLGEHQNQPSPSVMAIARPGWEMGAPVIAPFQPLLDFLGEPVHFLTTYNVESDHSTRVYLFSEDIGRLLEFVETLVAVQPTDDLMRTLTLSRLQDTTNSTGLQDLTQAPVGKITILSEEISILS